MSNFFLYKSEDRVHLISYTFIFSKHVNTNPVDCGILKNLNNVTLLAGMGLARQYFSNLEIITLVLEGAIWYHDSLNNHELLRPYEVQVISTGNRLSYALDNAFINKNAKILQIELCSNIQNIRPSQSKHAISFSSNQYEIKNVVMPQNIADTDNINHCLQINQNAWLFLGNIKEGYQPPYQVKQPNNTVYIFVISGSITINDYTLNSDDSIAIQDIDSFLIKANQVAQILILDFFCNHKLDR
jgi:hypothetical protein